MSHQLDGVLEAYLSGEQERTAPGSPIIRIELEIERTDPIRWLAAQEPTPRVYWSGRDNALELAGIGPADSLRITDLEPLLAAGVTDGIRYFGGMPFDPDNPSVEDSWEAFRNWRFLLPRFEMIRTESTTRFCCNMKPPKDERTIQTIQRELQKLTFDIKELAGHDHALAARSDEPNSEQWQHVIEHVLDKIANGTLQKLVPARTTLLRLGRPPDALTLLRLLNMSNPDCYHFCFQPVAETAFIGASPEQLYARKGRRIFSEAMAGTAGRAEDNRVDEALGAELLSSRKNRNEHRIVVRHIKESLSDLCSQIHDPCHVSLLKLAHVQHLVSRFEGNLLNDVSDSDILHGLHPTPAVSGFPTDEALATIRQIEPFDRGWYAGPVGWIGPDDAEFAVGIRSALVENDQVHLYAGAGIVPGSIPAQEWEELEHKISHFLDILART